MSWKYRTAKRRRRPWRAAAVIFMAVAAVLLAFVRLKSDSQTVPVQGIAATPAPCESADTDTELIPVPLLSQEDVDMPTGCELVSAYMVLDYYGCTLSFEEWVSACVPMQEFWYEDGILTNFSPREAFIGLPWQDGGYGCYAPVICEAMQLALPDCTVQDVTGHSLDRLCSEYLEKGIPVVIWATMGMEPSGEGSVWQTPDGPFEWVSNEHCLVLVGADSCYYFFNDPAQGRCAKWEKELVEQRYAELGMQAVVVSEG